MDTGVFAFPEAQPDPRTLDGQAVPGNGCPTSPSRHAWPMRSACQCSGLPAAFTMPIPRSFAQDNHR